VSLVGFSVRGIYRERGDLWIFNFLYPRARVTLSTLFVSSTETGRQCHLRARHSLYAFIQSHSSSSSTAGTPSVLTAWCDLVTGGFSAGAFCGGLSGVDLVRPWIHEPPPRSAAGRVLNRRQPAEGDERLHCRDQPVRVAAEIAACAHNVAHAYALESVRQYEAGHPAAVSAVFLAEQSE